MGHTVPQPNILWEKVFARYSEGCDIYIYIYIDFERIENRENINCCAHKLLI
jgi:hypothetical protein